MPGHIEGVTTGNLPGGRHLWRPKQRGMGPQTNHGPDPRHLPPILSILSTALAAATDRRLQPMRTVRTARHLLSPGLLCLVAGLLAMGPTVLVAGHMSGADLGTVLVIRNPGLESVR